MHRFEILIVAAISGLVLISSGSAASINGTNGNDILRGTRNADKIYGKKGNDSLFGLAGNDLLVPGPGADIVRCGSGRDTVRADKADKVSTDCEVVLGITPPPPPFVAGKYGGLTSQNERITFEITGDRSSLADLYVNDINQSCSAGPFNSTFQNRVNQSGFKFAVNRDGTLIFSYSFDTTYTSVQTGQVYRARNTFSIDGRLAGQAASGKLRLDSSGDLTCSSGLVTWTANLSG